MSADAMRVVTRVSRSAQDIDRTWTLGSGDSPRRAPLMHLLLADRNDVKREVKANAPMLRDYLTLHPNERRTLVAIQQSHQATDSARRNAG